MSTPPLQMPPLQSTPVHTRSRTLRFGRRFSDRDCIYAQLVDEMAPFFVGPMPPQEFLDTFLPLNKLSTSQPCTSFKEGRFSVLTGSLPENQLYDKFVCFSPPVL